MVHSGASRSGSESAQRSPTLKGKKASASASENATLVNSPDDAGRLASAKATGYNAASLSPPSTAQMHIKKNFQSSIGMIPGGHQQIDFDDDDGNESSIDSSLCSVSQMSMSSYSTNSGSTTRKLEQLAMKLEAVIASHRMLQFKAQTRLSTHGPVSRQYEHLTRKIEEKRLEIVSIQHRIDFRKSKIEAEDNPTMPSSKKNAGKLLVHMADDRTDIPSGITDDRGQFFRDKTTASFSGQKHRLGVTDQEEYAPARGRHRKQETVPDAPSEARGSMDLPATVRRSVSPTCASDTRSKVLPSRSSAHKSRPRSASVQSTRAKMSLEKRVRNTSRGSERGKVKVSEHNTTRMFDARLSDENARLREELQRITGNNQLLFQQATVHVEGLTENDLASKNELMRVRAIAEQETLRLTAELAKEVADRMEVERRLELSSRTHITRSDAQELYTSQEAIWAAEEQTIKAEYKMNLAEVRSEAQMFGLQSAGSANTTTHELKQELVSEQRLSLIEMRQR